MTEWSVNGGSLSARVINKEEKRVNILISALKVFTKKGISSATISDIAEEANIGKGTVYEYFKSKDEIVLSALTLFLDDSRFSINKLKKINGSPEEKLRNTIQLFIDIIKQESIQTFELIFDFWLIGIKEKKYKSDFYLYLKDFYSLYRGIFSDIVKEGQEKGMFNERYSPYYIGSMIIGMLDGLMAQWILDRENVNYIDTVKTMVNIIISGLKEV